MPSKTWVLVDHETSQVVDLPFRVLPEDVGGPARGYEVQVRQHQAGLSQGVWSVRLDNGRWAVDVLPTRGMSLWKAYHGSTTLGWKSPVRGPVHPMYVPLSEPSGLGWLSGFDELLVRCGLESNGAPEFDASGKLQYPLHGRIGNRPAHRVSLTIDGDRGVIELSGEVEETRFHFFKGRLTSTIRMPIDSMTLEIEDAVKNLSASPADVQLLYHTNLGRPLLDAGAHLVAPVKRVVPQNARAAEGIGSWNHFTGEQAGFAEQVYLCQLHADNNGKSEVLLQNAHATQAVSLRFDVQQLPCFSLWKNTTADEDGYVTGIEPGTNFPNPRSFEGDHGRVLTLDGQQEQRFQLQFAFHPDETSVNQARQRVEGLSQGEPRVESQPQSDWCAG